MTVGPSRLVELIRGMTGLDGNVRDYYAGAFGFWWAGYHGPDADEEILAAPAHIWAMCIEPSVRARESFLNSINDFAEMEYISPVRVAEIMGWLDVTGTDHAEVGYVEVFREILDRTGAQPEVPLTPERSAPLVDVLRGITSTLATERREAAGMVPDLLPELRADEAGCFAGVLARALVLEDDAAARNAQLATLCLAVEHGVLDLAGRRLVAEALTEATVDPALRARWQNLTPT